MKKKICFFMIMALLLLTLPVMAADNEDNGSESADSAYSQNNDCEGGACAWKK